jgi:hypothetical protein
MFFAPDGRGIAEKNEKPIFINHEIKNIRNYLK